MTPRLNSKFYILKYDSAMKRLDRKFFARDTERVAKELLGKILCREENGVIYRGKIIETEAYTQDDPACHAFCGQTERNKSLFKHPGTLYVYFTYGMHFCANISTEREGYGSGVLLRALEPVENINKTNGPALLCKSMNITKALDGSDLTSPVSSIWLQYEDAKLINKKDIVATTRIGIKKAAELKRRFYIKDNRWVSKK